MGFWLIVILFVASFVLSALLAPHPKGPGASSIGDFTAPTAEDGRAIPVIVGTCKVTGPNVTFYGALRNTPMKQKSGLFSSTTVGYKYYLGMQLVLGHGKGSTGGGSCELVDLYAGQYPDDVRVPYTVVSDDPDKTVIFVDQEKLFGGDKQEGGLRGRITFYKGTQTQVSDPYLSCVMFGGTWVNLNLWGWMNKVFKTEIRKPPLAGSPPAPAYKGICYAVLEDFYVGTTNYIKNLNFVVRRCPSNLSRPSTVTNINGDGNPVEAIYEALTNPVYALGFPGARTNVACFQKAADAIAAEGFGVSLQYDSQQGADDYIFNILRHIDAVIYTNPSTGLWEIVLARNDYDPATLPVLGPDDLNGAPQLGRTSWEETINVAKVIYMDRTTFKQKTAQFQETANIATTGEVTEETFSYLGISNGTLAQKVAAREAKTHSYPILKAKLNAKRVAWKYRPGSVFKLNWSADGITELVMRVVNINYGSLEDGKIEIDAVEDVFAIAYAAFTAPTDGGWVDPLGDPTPPAAQLAIESPFQLLVALSQNPLVGVGAVRGDNASEGYDLYTDKGTGMEFRARVGAFCPSGLLLAPYPRNTSAVDAVGFGINGNPDSWHLVGTDDAGRDAGDCLLYFADTGEICAYKDVELNEDGTQQVTGLVRGCFDTVPADHAAGVRVYFLFDNGISYLTDADGIPLAIPVGVSGDAGTGDTGGTGGTFTPGGDIGGDENSQTVIGIGGYPIDTSTPPVDGNILQFSGALSKWKYLTDRPIFLPSAVAGKPKPGQVVLAYIAPAAAYFPANFSGSPGYCLTPPSAPVMYLLYKGGVQCGAVSIATNGTVTFATLGGTPLTLNANEYIIGIAPGDQDPELADVFFTLVGTRTQTVTAGTPIPVLKNRELYVPEATYYPFEFVQYGSPISTYLCKVQCSGVAPTDTDHWQVLAGAGASGGVQVAGDIIGTASLPRVGGLYGVPLDPALATPPNKSSMVFDSASGLWKPGSGGNLTAKYIIGAADADLPNAVVNGHLITDPDLAPANPNAKNDEFLGNSLDPKWSILGQVAGQTVTVGNGCVALYTPPSVQGRTFAIHQPVPAGNWKARAKLNIEGATWNFFALGLSARRVNVLDRLLMGCVMWHSSYGTPTAYLGRFLGLTTLSQEVDLVNWGGNKFYMEIEFDGTNLTWRLSASGRVFQRMYQETVANWLGAPPETVGIHIHPWNDSTGNANWGGLATCEWFRFL